MENIQSLKQSVLRLAVFIVGPTFISALCLTALYVVPPLVIGGMAIVILGPAYMYIAWLPFRRAHKPPRYQLIAVMVIAITAIVLTVVGFAVIYRSLGITDTLTHKDVSDPTTALYFSIVTFTTLGYGDFRPVPEARLIAASEAMAGFVLMAALIAAFAKVFTTIFVPRGVDPSEYPVAVKTEKAD